LNKGYDEGVDSRKMDGVVIGASSLQQLDVKHRRSLSPLASHCHCCRHYKCRRYHPFITIVATVVAILATVLDTIGIIIVAFLTTTAVNIVVFAVVIVTVVVAIIVNAITVETATIAVVVIVSLAFHVFYSFPVAFFSKVNLKACAVLPPLSEGTLKALDEG
jgi:hypothetical protein